jgi:formylglycine-generating enzyme required for sulfatase activity
MKKLTLIFFALLFAFSLLPAGTIANVIAHKDLLLTIDRGTSDGVEIGMKGIVKAVYKEPSGEYTINIGIFTVKKASPRTAEVLIEIGKGLNPNDARYVVFDQDLLPVEVKTEPKAEPKTESVIPEKPVENADWYLEQGDREAEAGNPGIALQHYQKAAALAPDNLVAKEKCSEMQKQIDLDERKAKFVDYLEKADANYEKNDVKFAFLYLVQGLRIYPEGSAEIQSRLTPMAEKYPQEIDALLAEKSKELKDVRKQLDAMLGRTDALKPTPAETKTAEAKPAVAKASTPPVKYSEPFLQKIAGKADKIRQNDQGYWEAVFPRNIVMIYIPEGEFSIGSPAKDGDADEHPVHKVFVSGYWIGKTEVTFAQFDAFCQETGLAKPDDEGWGRGERPVIYISWKEANDFCAWLRKKTGFAFRLPTEAEWEKAARDRFPWGSAQPTNELANFDKELMKTSAVGSYPQGASPYGVLDMAGNVWEWLADWYADDYYANSADSDPLGPEEGTERVVRGGAWSNSAEQIRSGNRSQENPESRLNIIGFRLALSGK